MSKIQEQLENLDKRIKQAAEKQNKWKQELLKIQKLKDNLEGQNLFKQKKKIGSLNYQKYLVLGRAILENYEYNLVDTPKEIYDKIAPNLDDSHKVLIGYSDKENKNFTGLIANKILGNYGKPCLILREYNDETWAGSLRSPIDIADRINSSK